MDSSSIGKSLYSLFPVLPDPDHLNLPSNKKTIEILSKIEEEVARLRAQLDKDEKP